MGKTPFADGKIAAIAIHGLILVTNNVADYADFLSIQVETWLTNK